MTLAPAELLARLVAVASPSGDEAAVADLVQRLCADEGLATERVGHSVLLRVGAGGPRLFLNSHLDTVPVGAGWTGDPLDARWREADERVPERYMCARGANDAKASCAAMLHAAFELARGPEPPGTLLVALVACEETTNAGMADVLARLGADEAPDAAVTGEPTGLEVVRAQSGLAVLEAHWSGRACHAAHVARVPNENALTLAARELAAFPDHVELPGAHPLLGASTLTPTVLRAGERHNLVPDRAVCTFDARLAPPHDAAECARLLAERLPSARIEVRSERLRPVETAGEHPLVRCALAATGRTSAVGSSTMSDMALLAGVPAIKCGPGRTERSHTADEHVTEAELLAGCAFYRALVPAWFATATQRAVSAS